MGKTIQQLAEELRDQFETARRDNGESFDKLKTDAPEWMSDVMREAHGDMLPDDYRYSFIREAVELIADADADADVDSLRDQLEPATYTGDRLRWLASHLDRLGYVDSATEELGHSDQGVAGDIGQGQLAEKEEVFGQVLDALAELVENQDGADDE